MQYQQSSIKVKVQNRENHEKGANSQIALRVATIR